MPTLHETIAPAKRIRRIAVLISGSGSNLQALLDAASTPLLPSAQIVLVLSSRSNAYGLTRARSHNPSIPTSICALKTFLSRHPGSTREDYDAEVARQVLDSRPDLVVLAGWMHILSDAFLDVMNGVRVAPAGPALPPPGVDSLPGHGDVMLPMSDRPSPASTSALASPPSADSSSLTSVGPSSISEKLLAPPRSASSPAPLPPLHLPIPIINLHPALPGAFDGANAIDRAYAAFQRGEISHTGAMVHRVVRDVDRGQPLVVRQVEMRPGESQAELEARIHQVEHEIIVEGAKIVLEQLDEEAR